MADEKYVKKFKVASAEATEGEEVLIEAAKVTDTKEIEFGSGFNVTETDDKVSVTANFIPADTDLAGVVVTESAPSTPAEKTLYLFVESTSGQ